MTKAAERLKSQLAQLSARDRAALAHFLIRSLDDTSDPDAASAWDAELPQRLAEIRDGTVMGTPAEQVFSELRKKHS